jgi:Cd2+/Zn2+-exporting ATPase
VTAAGAPAPSTVPEHPPRVPGEDGCLEILSDRLHHSPGVVAIEANFRARTLTVRYRPSLIEPEGLNSLADEVAAMFAQRVTSCERRESLGACEECALRLGHLRAADGDLLVTAEPDVIGLSRSHPPADVVELIRPLERKPWGARMSAGEQEHLARGRSMAILTGSCLTLLAAGMVLERVAPPWQQPAYLASAVCGSWFALRSTARALARGRLDVNLLMILAAAGAASIGYVFEAAVLMFLFSLSNTLEVYTMGRTRQAIQALLRLRPARALVRRDGREIEVDAASVRIGERVVIRPGETFPVDGVIVTGASVADQSMLTGESVPVVKEPGDRVFAGTLNQLGALEVRATREHGDTTLARIVALVEEAQEQKSRTEELAQWVGRYYTIVVVFGAALMIVVPPIFLHEPFAPTFYRAMTLLVVASPCALVIATPATVLSAIANAARNGILFKGGRFLEALGRVRVVAFDKTGTLTRGRFAVTNVLALEGCDERQVLAWAASAERRSQHPLAQAVVREAEARGIEAAPAEQLTNVLGKGIRATLDGAEIEIGTPELFMHLGHPAPANAIAQTERLSAEATTSRLVH